MKNNITADLIKELRFRTRAGFLECKRALVEENGNIELSIDNLRKSGKINAEKKINNITNQGMIFAKTRDNIGVLLELNCETDFVSKDDLFVFLGKDIVSTALINKIQTIDHLKSIFEEKRTMLISKIGENINIRRFYFMKGECVLSYVHGVRIGVLVNSTLLNKTILKNIAMHIAASKPEYLHPENVCSKLFEREYKIQLELVKNLKKPANILNKIVEGRMKKFVNNISLKSQNFIMDSTKTVEDILNENSADIKSFMRFELGEMI